MTKSWSHLGAEQRGVCYPSLKRAVLWKYLIIAHKSASEKAATESRPVARETQTEVTMRRPFSSPWIAKRTEDC